MTPEALVGLVSALAAIGAAVVAGRYAKTTSEAAQAEQRAIELERRLSSVKRETYEPMIRAIQRALDSAKGVKGIPEEELRRTVSDFMTWAQVYASDEVVRSMNRWMKASSAATTQPAHLPPGTVSTYYLGRLLLALRKDLGSADTELTVQDLLAQRIVDIYESSATDYLTLTEDDFLKRTGWKTPWP